jgi:TetR/AcrR family transcriptional repressor of nem operon
MARTKEFDPDGALQKAMELFWRHGYEATSMARLTEHLGIGRASLYATFGDKRELYLRALRRYLETRDPDPLELLSQPGPAMPAVRALVEAYVQGTLEDEQRRGCLVVNSATELLPSDGPVSRVVESSWDGLEVALASAFTRARAQGELGRSREPRALARFLLVFLQGVRVMGRSTPNPERLWDAADQALSSLEV